MADWRRFTLMAMHTEPARSALRPDFPVGDRLVPRWFLVSALLLGFALIAVIVVSAATRRPEPDDLRRGADAFREATSLDSGSAAAWAGLADALHLLVLLGAVPPREGIPPAEEAALPVEPRGALRGIANWRLEHLKGRGETDHVPLYALAARQADLGNREEALAALRQALVERDPMLVSVDVDPAFDGVRTDPRFQEIGARVGGRSPRRPS